MTRERLASLANKYINILVNARLALCLASDGVLPLPICVTMIALRKNIVSVKQTRELRQQTFSCSSLVFCVQLSESGVQLSKLGV